MRQKGFTLMEIMVVMLIIGIITSIAGLSIRIQDKQYSFEHWLEGLEKKTTLIQDYALYGNKNYGLQFNTKAARFLEFKDNKWDLAAKENQPSMTQIEFPANSELILFINDQRVLLDDDYTEENIPQVIILNSGEIIPFELHLHNNDQTYILSLNDNGNLDHEIRD